MSSHFTIPLITQLCAPPQFEYRFHPMLEGRLDPALFQATVDECNKIFRDYGGTGNGCLNKGWICFPLMGCFCVQSCRLRRARRAVKIFLLAECQRIYLSLGIHLQIRKQASSYVDSTGRFHKEMAIHLRVDVAKVLSPQLPSYQSPLYHPAGDDSLPSDSLDQVEYFSDLQEDAKLDSIVFPSSNSSDHSDFMMPPPPPYYHASPIDEVSESTSLLS